MQMQTDWIVPDWPVPIQVKSIMTTRLGGISPSPYDSMNLAYHVQDDAQYVAANRACLQETLGLSKRPFWVNQVHGVDVADVSKDTTGCDADAVYSRERGMACCVMTADCLPVLLCDREGREVAAVHAGWRGLQQGVIEQAIEHFSAAPKDIYVWLGAAISVKAFEVGDEVRQAFIRDNEQDAACFYAVNNGHWMADLYQLARQRLARIGIGYVGGGDYCTFTDSRRFYSYRREAVTGRMASLIWIEG